MVATFLREVLAKELLEAQCIDVKINLAEFTGVRNALKRFV